MHQKGHARICLSAELMGLMYYDPCFARTAYSHSLKTNSPAVTKVIDTYHEYRSKENWMTNTVLYELNNFIDIFRVNFAEEKRPNFKVSYLLFHCEFEAISNAGLKSRICSDRLQNVIFVQWELALDEAVKWSDPFHNSKKKKKVPRSVYRRERIKVALNSVSSHGQVTDQNDTEHKYSLILNWQFSFMQHSIKCLRLVQNIYSKWLTHHFWHFSSSAKGFLALLGWEKF